MPVFQMLRLNLTQISRREVHVDTFLQRIFTAYESGWTAKAENYFLANTLVGESDLTLCGGPYFSHLLLEWSVMDQAQNN